MLDGWFHRMPRFERDVPMATLSRTGFFRLARNPRDMCTAVMAFPLLGDVDHSAVWLGLKVIRAYCNELRLRSEGSGSDSLPTQWHPVGDTELPGVACRRGSASGTHPWNACYPITRSDRDVQHSKV